MGIRSGGRGKTHTSIGNDREWKLLSATTADLRKFALQHAEDKEAFSETFAFRRKKVNCNLRSWLKYER